MVLIVDKFLCSLEREWYKNPEWVVPLAGGAAGSVALGRRAWFVHRHSRVPYPETYFLTKCALLRLDPAHLPKKGVLLTGAVAASLSPVALVQLGRVIYKRWWKV